MKLYDYVLSYSGCQKVSENFLNVGFGRTYIHFHHDLMVNSSVDKNKENIIKVLHVIGLIFASIVTLIFLIIREVGRAKLSKLAPLEMEPLINIAHNLTDRSESAYTHFKDPGFRKNLTCLVIHHQTLKDNELCASIILDVFEDIRTMITAKEGVAPPLSDIMNLNELVTIMRQTLNNELLCSDSCKKLSPQTFESLSIVEEYTRDPFDIANFIDATIHEQIDLLKKMVNCTSFDTFSSARIYIESYLNFTDDPIDEKTIYDINELIALLKKNNRSKGFNISSIEQMQSIKLQN